MNNGFFAEIGPVKKRLIKLTTASLRKFLPEMALSLSKKIILQPVKRTDVWPQEVNQQSYLTRHGEVKVYSYGQGPVIWLVHGWSGSGSQFWPLMLKLADKGFSTVTFDFPAHGESEGNYSSLPLMIHAFDDLTKHLPPTDFVITHSMGASIVANCQWFKSYHHNLMIISPILETYNLLQQTVRRTGFDYKLFKQMVKDSFIEHHMFLPDLDAVRTLVEFTGCLKIIHDVDDKFSPLTSSKKLAGLSGAELYITRNLGHGKILNSQQVIDLI